VSTVSTLGTCEEPLRGAREEEYLSNNTHYCGATPQRTRLCFPPVG
jgi:hypothetical protein